MIRVAASELQPGMELARSIPHPDAPEQNLLERGFRLTQKEIDGLRRHQIRDCWIRHERMAFLEDLLPEAHMESQRRTMSAVRGAFERIAGEQVIDLSLRQLTAAVHDLLATMRAHPLSFACMEALSSAGNEAAAHAAEVCGLSLLLGLRLENYLVKQRKSLQHSHASETANLGLGALLHDIGRLRLPPELQHPRREPYTRAEAEALRQHPETGFEMTRHALEASAANIVLNHHQRWDGHGYPSRAEGAAEKGAPAGESIPVFSRIVAVANHFAAARSRFNPDGTRCTAAQVIFEMRFAVYRQWFDPVVEEVFHRVTPPFPVGSRVTLNTGPTAAVLDFLPEAPCQPPVALLSDPAGAPLAEGAEGGEVRLAETPDIYIQACEGQDVARYLF